MIAPGLGGAIPDVMKVTDKGDTLPRAYINRGVPQIIYDNNMDTVVLGCNQLYFLLNRQVANNYSLRLVDDLALMISSFEEIIFHRSYAIGDILTCIPVVRYFNKKYGKKVTFATAKKFKEVMRGVKDFSLMDCDRGVSVKTTNQQLCVNLDDNTMELDHSKTHPFRSMHRTDILRFLLGIDRVTDFEYDYSIPVEEEETKNITAWLRLNGLEGQEFVTFQWEGSNPIKTFADLGFRIELIRRIQELMGIKVVVLSSVKTNKPNFNNPNIIPCFATLSLKEALAFTKFAKINICMDSAPLWFAHCTNSPVICMMGATEADTKIIHHPLYRLGKAVAIQTHDLVGCPEPCRHMLDWCDSKITCMSPPMDALWGRLKAAIEGILARL